MTFSTDDFASRVRLLLGLLAVCAVGLLALQAGSAEARTIYACAQKHGSTQHRAKAALRLVRKSAACLPWERRLTGLPAPAGRPARP